MKWPGLSAEMLNCILELNSDVLFWRWHALFTPSWQAKFLVVDSRLFSHPLTGILKRILSPKLPNWGAAYSSKGRAKLPPHLHKLLSYKTNSCVDKGPEAITTASMHPQWTGQVHSALWWSAILCAILGLSSSCVPIELYHVSQKRHTV